jgi:hypothetical protein
MGSSKRIDSATSPSWGHLAVALSFSRLRAALKRSKRRMPEPEASIPRQELKAFAEIYVRIAEFFFEGVNAVLVDYQDYH